MARMNVYDTEFQADTLSDLEWEAEFEQAWRRLTEQAPRRRRDDPMGATVRAIGATRVMAAVSKLIR